VITSPGIVKLKGMCRNTVDQRGVAGGYTLSGTPEPRVSLRSAKTPRDPEFVRAAAGESGGKCIGNMILVFSTTSAGRASNRSVEIKDASLSIGASPRTRDMIVCSLVFGNDGPE